MKDIAKGLNVFKEELDNTKHKKNTKHVWQR